MILRSMPGDKLSIYYIKHDIKCDRAVTVIAFVI
jgi:hypothetical protein